MGEKTGITWCDATFNPVWGCTKISPGCAACYAEGFANRCGFDCFGPGKPRRKFKDKHWNEPKRWNLDASKSGTRTKVFCGSMCDVMEDNPDLDEARPSLWSLIEQTPNLDWLICTKRTENYSRFLPLDWIHHPPRNLWLGTTIESDAQLYRYPLLMRMKAVVRWLSVEPMLSQVDIRWEARTHGKVDWIVYGAESRGSGIGRPCDVAWVRRGLGECREHGIVPFVKQLHLDGRLSKEPGEWPEDLQVQRFPVVRIDVT